MTNTELIQALRDKESRDNRELLDRAAHVIESLTQPAQPGTAVETNTGKIDCNITENYFKEKRRMSNFNGNSCSIECDDCPLSIHNNNQRVLCRELEYMYPTEAVAAVQKWSDEHPAKTVKADFLEKFPNAFLDKDGIPTGCIRWLGYHHITCPPAGLCTECWNKPLSEV